MNKEKAIVDNLNDERVVTFDSKDTREIKEKEFKLSEKIWNWGDESIRVKDIKEFIRLLKESIKSNIDFCDVDGRKIMFNLTDVDYKEILEDVDKLVGDLK